MEPARLTGMRGEEWSVGPCADLRTATETGHGPQRALPWDSVIAGIEGQVALSPDRVAVRCGTRTLTYGELDAAANRLARHLRDLGVGRGHRVALLLSRGIEAVSAILAVIKAGAAYVPVDSSYPEARIRFIVEDCAAPFVITTSTEAQKLAPRTPRIELDRDEAAIAACSAAPISPRAGADDPIYVIYTSGSTGQPKGASVSHRSFANLLNWYIGALSLGARDATLLVSALGFDLTQKNIFAPLLVGGTLHLPAFDGFDPQAIVSAIEEQSITFLNCTPSTFLPLAEGPAAIRAERLSSLRWVVLGGEPIPIRRLLPWLQHPSCGARILNTYGPTECTDICAAWAVDGREWTDPVPLGMPIDNVFLAVLDELRRPVGAGIEGELWIGGEGVGHGYLGRPDLTAERFMPLQLPGFSGRLYRTGDRVVRRADGTLEFLGRFDHQIKIRGFRIELGEIEAALCSHPGIREACVSMHQAEGAEPRLVAHVVPRDLGGAPGEQQLRSHVALSLPDHMVPSTFITLPAMPLSPNGKIDRHALPAPDQKATASSAPDDAALREPAGTEAILRDIWRNVLGREPESRDQAFFDAGGTSLGMARVQSAIRTRLGRDVPIVALFAHPTIASQARHLDQDRPAQGVARQAGLKQMEAMRKLAQARGRRP